MKRTEYENKRAALYAEAEQLLNDGKAEDAQAKMEEIKTLDNTYEEESKMQANLNALKDPVGAAGFAAGAAAGEPVAAAETENILDSIEYRQAFMNYALNGVAIPEKFQNTAGPTKTTDVVISPAVAQKIYEKVESFGGILQLVTKTMYPAGVTVPVSSVKPVATWVAEGSGSDIQKLALGHIDIKGYKLRCAVSMTIEAATMSLASFEAYFIASVSKAMAKALEASFINGTGTGQPKGVLKETVVAGQNVDIAKSADVTYKTLTAAEGALPLGYENTAVWNMTKKTFMAFEGMTDTNGNPIARTNYGLGGKPERFLLGRRVELNEHMVSLGDTISADTVVAFLFDWSSYMFNTNMAMRLKTYEDNDTDDQVAKAILIADGKVIDKNSLVTVTKKNA